MDRYKSTATKDLNDESINDDQNPYLEGLVNQTNQLGLETSYLGLSSHNHDKCFMKQIYTISMYYFINVLTDFMLFILGKEALDEHALYCASH